MKITIRTIDIECPICKTIYKRDKYAAKKNKICRACGMKKTYIEKHGSFEEAMKLREIKRKQTCIERYDVDNPMQIDSVKKKVGDTCQKKYGHRSIIGNKETMREIFDEKFDGIDPAHSITARKKRIETSLKRFGAPHAMKNHDVQTKLKRTWLTKTGFDHPMKNPEVKKGMIERNGAIGTNIFNGGYYFDSIHFHSSFELAYFLWLKYKNKQFIFHPKFTFEYIGDDGESHFYLPDFLVEGIFYEIKGDQFFNKKGEPYNNYTKTFWWDKFNKMKENGIIILRQKDMKPMLEFVKINYGKDFLKSCKKKKRVDRSTRI